MPSPITIHEFKQFGFYRLLISLVLASLIILTSGYLALAQTTSPTDGSTPLGLSPGAPVGSYSVSGFESINPYNGNLSFHLPLVGIGGRGGAGMVSSLSIDAKGWTVRHQETTDLQGNPVDVYTPVESPWAPKPGYGPGTLIGRQSGIDPTQTCQAPGGGIIRYLYWQTLTRLTFTAANGTEYEFRDQLTGGQPAQVISPCTTGASRGTVFITADGTAATFISDSVIYDKNQSRGSSMIFPSGNLMLRDGTKYRIDGGAVTWMRDRNGNKLTFSYNGSVTTITDSLNRQVSFTYADYSSTFSDQITVKGFGGATRTILVNYATLSNALRSGYSIQTYRGLFPELNNASQYTQWNPWVVSSVTLPNGQQYQLQYNSYAELARVVLPTGGAIEYDYTSGSGAVTDGDNYQIYRRVTTRRVYADGTNLEGYTTFGDGSGGSAITVDQLTPSGALLTREKHYYYGSAGSSLFAATGISYPARRDGREYKTEAYAADGTTLLRRTETSWANRGPVSWWWNPGDVTEPPNDSRVTDVTNTLADVSPNLVSKQTFGYDDLVPYNNRNNVKEYDYGSGTPGALVRETRTTYVTSSNYIDASTGAHIRSLPSQASIYDASGVEKARTTYEYDNYTVDTNHAGLINRSNISGLDSAFTTSYGYRGNATGTTHYLLNTGGSVTGSVSAFAQYDIAGNVVKSIDGRGNATTFDYRDNFGSPGEAVESGGDPVNTPPGNLASQIAYALPFKITNALGQTAYSKYDYYLGRPVDAEDANGITYCGYSDNEALDRPTKIVRAANQNSSLKSQTTFSYDDTNHVITITSDFTSFGDGALVRKTFYDGLGRTSEARTYEGGTNYITVETQFDALGRAYKNSNPFRPWQSESAVWTTTAFDALGRTVSVTTPDGSVATSSYAGNSVTGSDQTGKSRKSVTDALGRLTTVFEDPAGLSYQTSYSYDELNDLLTVNQVSQTRTFVYDSLKRLMSATNPENGFICYGTVVNSQCQANGYDNNGNLLYRTDARGILTIIAYDVLNRPTSKTYSNDPSGTPVVNYSYDNQTLPPGAPSFTRGASIGKLVAITYGGNNNSAGDYYGFDPIGRDILKIQQTGGINYPISAAYNAAGALTSETYPSNRTVSYSYDSAGRANSVTGTLGDDTSRSYATGISYSSFGSLKQEQYGTTTPIYNKLFYNSRGQLSEIRESTTPNDTSWNRGAIINQYSFQCWGAACSGTDNNGNLKKQEVYVPDNDQVTTYKSWFDQYDYDSLNRLTQVHEYTGNTSLDWQQAYNYDRWGNRTIDGNSSKTFGSGINNMQASIDQTNNRLYAPNDSNHTLIDYDLAGNQTKDLLTSNSSTRSYDAESRMISSTDTNNQTSTYTYDGEGKRIKRNVIGAETWQVYGLGGELVAEYAANANPNSPQKEYGYRNGQLLITADKSTGPPPTPIFSDNFNSTTLDASKWSVVAPSSSAVVSDNGQQLQISLQPSTAAYNGVYSNSTYDLTGRMVQVEETQAVSQTGWCENYIQIALDGNNYFLMDSGAGSLLMRSMVGGVNNQTVLSFDPTAHRLWRIRHDQTANTINFETSSDGTNWVTRKVAAVGFSLSSLRFYLYAGAWGTGNSNPGAAKYDNFQLLSSANARVNVALAVNGSTATASSTYNGFSPTAAIDGEHQGQNWLNGGGWHGATNTFPQSLEVDFNANKTISEIDVYTVQDNYASPSEPTESMTFSLYGLTAYEVQYWNGTSWTDVPGGNVSGNNKVWRKFTFSPITTSKIQVLTHASVDGYTRIPEVEAWTPGSTTTNVRWLVSDQLGTPRMIFDQSGSLANVSRHDYLPFGEELVAGQGLRTSVQGYGASDSLRQHFTGQERDNETGLDYMHARYYSNMTGRFTAPDTLLGSLVNPQTFNRYAYVDNNPLNFSDPTGHTRFDASSNGFAEAMSDEGGGYMSPENPDFDPESILSDNMRSALHDYNQRLQNTRDANAANEAQGRGDFAMRDRIMDGNSSLEYEDFGLVTVSAEITGIAPDDQHNGNLTMVIIWDSVSGINPDRWFGHVSYITMDDDTSYSWQGIWNWTKDQPSSKYTSERSKDSAGLGYILDFGSTKINEKFQNALKHAYDYSYSGYGPISDNCGAAFNRAINAISKDIGVPMSINIRPSAIREYIEKNLKPRNFVVGQREFPKHN